MAREVTAEFFSELAVRPLRAVARPRVVAGALSLVLQADGRHPSSARRRATWVQWYDETVEIAAGERWTTRLRFNHRAFYGSSSAPTTGCGCRTSAGIPPGHRPRPTANLLVDEGFLVAEKFTGQQPGFMSRLTMVKIADFVDDEIDAWTTLMCDTFWLTLAIEMAEAAAEAAAGPDDTDDIP